MVRSPKKRLFVSDRAPSIACCKRKFMLLWASKYPQKKYEFYFLHFPLIGTRLV